MKSPFKSCCLFVSVVLSLILLLFFCVMIGLFYQERYYRQSLLDQRQEINQDVQDIVLYLQENARMPLTIDLPRINEQPVYRWKYVRENNYRCYVIIVGGFHNTLTCVIEYDSDKNMIVIEWLLNGRAISKPEIIEETRTENGHGEYRNTSTMNLVERLPRSTHLATGRKWCTIEVVNFWSSVIAHCN